VGYVPQSIFVLDETVRRNIAFGLEEHEIDDARIAEVVRMARIEAEIEAMTDKLETVVGERGVRLSGGQRQRIGIARALYGAPEILVMDEATSALDASTEHEIGSAIKALSKQITLIVIAHRLSTVRDCDRLFFLKDGRLVDQGGYDELYARNEDFYRMVVHQENEHHGAPPRDARKIIA
jgi:ATP-binding cassette subfamily C protein